MGGVYGYNVAASQSMPPITFSGASPRVWRRAGRIQHVAEQLRHPGSGLGAATFAKVPEPATLTLLSSIWTLLALSGFQRRLRLAAPILTGGPR